MPEKKYRHDGGASSAWVKEVGERLLWVRLLVADTQTQAAKMVRCDQSTFSLYEKGERLVSLQVAMRACEAWGITLDYLYRGRLDSRVAQDVAVRLSAEHPELVLGRGAGAARRAKEADPVS